MKKRDSIRAMDNTIEEKVNDFEPGELVTDPATISIFKHRDRYALPIRNDSLLSRFYKDTFFRLCLEHKDETAISQAAENWSRCSSTVNEGVTRGRFLQWLEEAGLSMLRVKKITGRDLRKPRPLDEKIVFTELDLEKIAALSR